MSDLYWRPTMSIGMRKLMCNTASTVHRGTYCPGITNLAYHRPPFAVVHITHRPPQLRGGTYCLPSSQLRGGPYCLPSSQLRGGTSCLPTVTLQSGTYCPPSSRLRGGTYCLPSSQVRGGTYCLPSSQFQCDTYCLSSGSGLLSCFFYDWHSSWPFLPALTCPR